MVQNAMSQTCVTWSGSSGDVVGTPVVLVPPQHVYDTEGRAREAGHQDERVSLARAGPRQLAQDVALVRVQQEVTPGSSGRRNIRDLE